MANKLFWSIFLTSFSLNSFAQFRGNLGEKEMKFYNAELAQFKLEANLKNQKYDSSIIINHEGGSYLLAKHGDSLDIIQNIVVNKIKDPKSSRVIKKIIKKEIVYSGLMDTILINKSIFDSLYAFGESPQVINSPIGAPTNSLEPDESFINISIYKNGKRVDLYRFDNLLFNFPQLSIMGWHIRRLILQLYFDYGHWEKVDKIIKQNGKGYYVLNNLIPRSTIYFFDGEKYTEYYGGTPWNSYFPTKFVLPKHSKPDNKYPVWPKLPEGARFSISN